MLQAGLLVLHMGRSEHFDKFLVLWFEKFLQFSKRFFCIGQDLGHKCLEIIVILILDPMSRTRKSFTINFDIYIWSGIFRYQ